VTDGPKESGRYAEALSRWVEIARERTGSGQADAVAEEVDTYLEELQVAEEELRVQNDELEAALREAEAQRRRYAELFDNAPLPYLTTDPSGAILEANRQAAELLGVSQERLQRKPLPLYLAGGGDLRTRISQVAACEAVEPWETVIQSRDGADIPVAVIVRPVVSAAQAGAGGSATEIQWVLQDIRPRRDARARERDLHREQAARAALEQVAIRARFLSDASRRLMGVLEPVRVWRLAAELASEQSAAALVVEAGSENGAPVVVRGVAGERTRELEGWVDRELGELEDAAARIPVQVLHRALERGEPEVVTSTPDQADDTGACLVVPIRSPERTLGAMVLWLRAGARIGEELLVARNLADRFALALESAALFEEVVRSRRIAEEASTTEADFLSIVSHELRTPLTAIVSYAELLEDRAAELPDRTARYAHQIATAADHQRQLVEQILSYKNLQREGDRVDLEELDYRKVSRSAVAMVRPQIEDRDVEIEEVLPAVAVQGVCDRGKLQQILTNLLANAVRHTDQGRVRLTVETHHQWVVFTVADTGEGIPEEDLPRIFDRFWRGTGGSRNQSGSGLGLTITRELVRRLRGEIEVESEPGAGTTFTVRVPRVAPGD
jgi:PAS domain S-box-containing protein